MFKKIFIILALFITSTAVYAGVYEDAIKKSDNVFLYMYAKDCRTCKVFDSIYNNMRKQNKNYAYVKVDVETPYGSKLMYKFKGHYVPYIILTNSKTKKSVNINHTCVMDEVCLMRAMKSFKG